VKLTIEPTQEFFMAGDVMVRMWAGHTDDGSPVIALVTAVMFEVDAKATAEGLGLVSIPPPDENAAVRWAETVMQRRQGDDG
jgi:hypothetical protein